MSNNLGRPPFAVDTLYRATNKRQFRGKCVNLHWNSKRQALELDQSAGQNGPGKKKTIRGSYTSEPVKCRISFDEVLPSWNIELNELSQGYRIHLRVGTADGSWSPWFYFGSGGTKSNAPGRKAIESPRWGRVNVDYLQLRRAATLFQFRVELESSTGLEINILPPALKRFFVSHTNTEGHEGLHRATRNNEQAARVTAAKRSHVRVPYRSQRAVSVRQLRDKICSPTCVSMMLEHHGINLATLDVAHAAYDDEHRIYGIWPRAAQVAGAFGLEAWVQRFREHSQVRSMLAASQPVMASIRVGRGDLKAARYKTSNGHLILLVGYTASGNYIVNDPYSEGAGGAEIEYTEAEIAKVWLDKGGVGIVIRRPGVKN